VQVGDVFYIVLMLLCDVLFTVFTTIDIVVQLAMHNLRFLVFLFWLCQIIFAICMLVVNYFCRHVSLVAMWHLNILQASYNPLFI